MFSSKSTLNAGIAGMKEKVSLIIHAGHTGQENGHRSVVTYLDIIVVIVDYLGKRSWILKNCLP